jgi:hypothetical protein
VNEAVQRRASDAGPEPRLRSDRRFSARIGRFERSAELATMDALVRLVENAYRQALEQRPSLHVYVRKLPADMVSLIDRLRNSDVIRDAIMEQVEPGAVVTPMPHTDELYISHYNKDKGGDQGLFDKHYDGNLRFMPVGAVVRALIYLQSDATYKVVFADSGVEKAFASYEFGILDFHRELHWVEGAYDPNDRQRILLKCNYLIAPRNAVWVTKGLLAANTLVFYVVKAAMEYSKSPTTVPQHVVGGLCNVARVLNNIHPLVPLAALGFGLVAAGWGLISLLG